jgi:hypothetical protein
VGHPRPGTHAAVVLHGGDLSLPFALVGERAGGDQGEPAGDLGAASPGQQAGFLDVDAGIDESGRQALGEVLEGVSDFGAVAAGERDVVEFVDQHHPGRVSVQTPTTDSMMSVMFERARTGRPRKRANSVAIMRAVAAGGTVT